MSPVMRLPHSVAEILVDIAERQAASMNVPMAIAIVDGEGGLQLFKRMDDTLPVSTELAVSKAYTSAVLRMPTHLLGELAQPGGALYGIQHTHNGRIILFGGGYPLCIGDHVVGAIGVSGGSVEQDMLAAQPAVKLFQDVQRWAEEMKELLPHGTRSSSARQVAVKDSLMRALAGVAPQVSKDTLAALTGGVLLALE
jgi:uncharacterized protein GlcG (DUF336 family)